MSGIFKRISLMTTAKFYSLSFFSCYCSSTEKIMTNMAANKKR